MKKILIILFTLLICTNVIAAGYQNGQVVQILTRSNDGLTWFYLSGTASGHPTCATNTYWILPNPSTEIGKRQLSTLMAAKAQGLPVTVFGTNTCTTWGDGEDALVIVY